MPIKIYIKTFNRPFYLERCLKSIRFNVKNYEKIVVLDDGTLSKYKNKLHADNPDVEFVYSNADDNKYQLVKQGKFNDVAIYYDRPVSLWVNAIRQDSNDYIIVLEDDTWFVNKIDLTEVEKKIKANTLLIKLFWGEDYMSCSDSIYDRAKIKYGHSIEYYTPNLSTIQDVWKIWLQCMSIYRKDYWLNSYIGDGDGVNNESMQLNRVVDFLRSQKDEAFFAKTDVRFVYQGWAAPGRSDSKYYNIGLSQHEFLDCLNEDWFNNTFDTTESYPFDFSHNYLLSKFKKVIGDDQIKYWIQWRNGEFGEGYTNYYNK